MTASTLSRKKIGSVLLRQYDTAWRVLAEAEERNFSLEHQLSLWGYLQGLSFSLHVVQLDHSAYDAHPLAAKLRALDQVH